MKILMLETATEKSAIILSQNGQALAVKFLPGGPDLSRSLSKELKELLDLYQFQPNLVAVGQGPGSFTGIRVGAALGQALSYGWKVPLTGFGSLQGFAPRVSGRFAVLVDARSGGFYTLIGDREEGKISFQMPIRLPLSEVSEALRGIDQIASPHPQLIQNRFKDDKILFETAPDPELLAELVLEKPATPLELIY